MPIGDEDDFRMQGFQQKQRFPAQDRLGGTGSPMPLTLTEPTGSVNMQSPVAPLALPALELPNITFPAVSLPPALPPVVIQPATVGTPTGGVTTITVEDVPAGTSYSGIDTLQFDGSVAVSNPPGMPNVAYINVTGGGGGGGTTSLIYGQITNAVKATYAQWTYTVQPYILGVATGAAVTAYNLFEVDNDNATAYGYSITGAGYDKIFGTSYYIRSVPIGNWVRMEYTDAIPTSSGLLAYFFTAPNRIDGGC